MSLEIITENLIRAGMVIGLGGIVTVAGVYFRAKVKDEVKVHNLSDTAHTNRFRYTNDNVTQNKGALDILSERIDQRFKAVTDILHRQTDDTKNLDSKLDRIIENTQR